MTFASCSLTPDEKYRLLTFFFDDVPPPYTESREEVRASAMTLEPSIPAAPVRKLRYVLHGPYSDRKHCNLCHAGDLRERLTVPVEELCWRCHQREDVLLGGILHAPVEAEACTACHRPHKSKHAFLLVRPAAEICAECHDEDTFEALGEHRAEQGDDCLGCHDAHASDREYLLLGEIER
jgi:predicted CXXCH cytochrome family protein